MSELSSLIGTLWESNSVYQERHTLEEVNQMQLELVTSTYRFSPMVRSFIPKPKKAGQFRAITQPASKDRFLLEALAKILNQALDNSFSNHSHGFRPRRGPISFFRAVKEWPALDLLIQCDIEKCFDRIDHELLLSFLTDKLGSQNFMMVDLIASFLKTPIFDKRGHNYT